MMKTGKTKDLQHEFDVANVLMGLGLPIVPHFMISLDDELVLVRGPVSRYSLGDYCFAMQQGDHEYLETELSLVQPDRLDVCGLRKYQSHLRTLFDGCVDNVVKILDFTPGPNVPWGSVTLDNIDCTGHLYDFGAFRKNGHTLDDRLVCAHHIMSLGSACDAIFPDQLLRYVFGEDMNPDSARALIEDGLWISKVKALCYLQQANPHKPDLGSVLFVEEVDGEIRLAGIFNWLFGMQLINWKIINNLDDLLSTAYKVNNPLNFASGRISISGTVHSVGRQSFDVPKGSSSKPMVDPVVLAHLLDIAPDFSEFGSFFFTAATDTSVRDDFNLYRYQHGHYFNWSFIEASYEWFLRKLDPIRTEGVLDYQEGRPRTSSPGVGLRATSRDIGAVTQRDIYDCLSATAIEELGEASLHTILPSVNKATGKIALGAKARVRSVSAAPFFTNFCLKHRKRKVLNSMVQVGKSGKLPYAIGVSKFKCGFHNYVKLLNKNNFNLEECVCSGADLPKCDRCYPVVNRMMNAFLLFELGNAPARSKLAINQLHSYLVSFSHVDGELMMKPGGTDSGDVETIQINTLHSHWLHLVTVFLSMLEYPENSSELDSSYSTLRRLAFRAYSTSDYTGLLDTLDSFFEAQYFKLFLGDDSCIAKPNNSVPNVFIPENVAGKWSAILGTRVSPQKSWCKYGVLEDFCSQELIYVHINGQYTLQFKPKIPRLFDALLNILKPLTVFERLVRVASFCAEGAIWYYVDSCRRVWDILFGLLKRCWEDCEYAGFVPLPHVMSTEKFYLSLLMPVSADGYDSSRLLEFLTPDIDFDLVPIREDVASRVDLINQLVVYDACKVKLQAAKMTTKKNFEPVCTFCANVTHTVCLQCPVPYALCGYCLYSHVKVTGHRYSGVGTCFCGQSDVRHLYYEYRNDGYGYVCSEHVGEFAMPLLDDELGCMRVSTSNYCSRRADSFIGAIHEVPDLDYYPTWSSLIENTSFLVPESKRVAIHQRHSDDLAELRVQRKGGVGSHDMCVLDRRIAALCKSCRQTGVSNLDIVDAGDCNVLKYSSLFVRGYNITRLLHASYLQEADNRSDVRPVFYMTHAEFVLTAIWAEKCHEVVLPSRSADQYMWCRLESNKVSNQNMYVDVLKPRVGVNLEKVSSGESLHRSVRQRLTIMPLNVQIDIPSSKEVWALYLATDTERNMYWTHCHYWILRVRDDVIISRSHYDLLSKRLCTFLLGPPGTGKTYSMVKLIQDNPGKKFQFLSKTHYNVMNFEQTLHDVGITDVSVNVTAHCVHMNGAPGVQQYKQLERNKVGARVVLNTVVKPTKLADYDVIIDECGQLTPAELYRAILKSGAGVVYLCGDPFQNSPVMPFDFSWKFETFYIRHLLRSERVHCLSRVYRCASEVLECWAKPYRDAGIKLSAVRSGGTVNIVVTRDEFEHTHRAFSGRLTLFNYRVEVNRGNLVGERFYTIQSSQGVTYREPLCVSMTGGSTFAKNINTLIVALSRATDELTLYICPILYYYFRHYFGWGNVIHGDCRPVSEQLSTVEVGLAAVDVDDHLSRNAGLPSGQYGDMRSMRNYVLRLDDPHFQSKFLALPLARLLFSDIEMYHVSHSNRTKNTLEIGQIAWLCGDVFSQMYVRPSGGRRAIKVQKGWEWMMNQLPLSHAASVDAFLRNVHAIAPAGPIFVFYNGDNDVRALSMYCSPRQKCSICNDQAVWVVRPMQSFGGIDIDSVYCDTHTPPNVWVVKLCNVSSISITSELALGKYLVASSSADHTAYGDVRAFVQLLLSKCDIAVSVSSSNIEVPGSNLKLGTHRIPSGTEWRLPRGLHGVIDEQGLDDHMSLIISVSRDSVSVGETRFTPPEEARSCRDVSYLIGEGECTVYARSALLAPSAIPTRDLFRRVSLASTNHPGPVWEVTDGGHQLNCVVSGLCKLCSALWGWFLQNCDNDSVRFDLHSYTADERRYLELLKSIDMRTGSAQFFGSSDKNSSYVVTYPIGTPYPVEQCVRHACFRSKNPIPLESVFVGLHISCSVGIAVPGLTIIHPAELWDDNHEELLYPGRILSTTQLDHNDYVLISWSVVKQDHAMYGHHMGFRVYDVVTSGVSSDLPPFVLTHYVDGKVSPFKDTLWSTGRLLLWPTLGPAYDGEEKIVHPHITEGETTKTTVGGFHVYNSILRNKDFRISMEPVPTDAVQFAIIVTSDADNTRGYSDKVMTSLLDVFLPDLWSVLLDSVKSVTTQSTNVKCYIDFRQYNFMIWLNPIGSAERFVTFYPHIHVYEPDVVAEPFRNFQYKPYRVMHNWLVIPESVIDNGVTWDLPNYHDSVVGEPRNFFKYFQMSWALGNLLHVPDELKVLHVGSASPGYDIPIGDLFIYMHWLCVPKMRVHSFDFLPSKHRVFPEPPHEVQALLARQFIEHVNPQTDPALICNAQKLADDCDDPTIRYGLIFSDVYPVCVSFVFTLLSLLPQGGHLVLKLTRSAVVPDGDLEPSEISRYFSKLYIVRCNVSAQCSEHFFVFTGYTRMYGTPLCSERWFSGMACQRNLLSLRPHNHILNWPKPTRLGPKFDPRDIAISLKNLTEEEAEEVGSVGRVIFDTVTDC